MNQFSVPLFFLVRASVVGMGLAASLTLPGLALAQTREADRTATEDDYFATVPVVLTASRLDQPLNEAPGAITVINRQTIRLSGARTVAEVLTLVPGYLTGGRNGANPGASYHIPIDEYGTRNLVLIDGRSVYSSTYLGDTHRGMVDVLLEDIDRIEVLRGANSAAYGANAMFGVINIITRHSADTVGGEVSVTQGDNGVRDRYVRIGGGSETASFRLSAGVQRDTGYLNAYDDKRLMQLQLRADFKPSPMDDVMLTAGSSYLSAGEGFAGDPGNDLHTIYTRDSHWNVVWRRQLSGTDELQVSASHMEDRKQDAAPYGDIPEIILDYGGVGRRTNLEIQRKMALGEGVRAVMGVGYKSEAAQSAPLYARPDWLSFHEERVFGTVEWRMTPHWLFNAGLFVANQSLTGTYTAPRLMVNWLASPEHTFRAGVTESVRAPSLFEYAGNIRYDLNGALVYVDTTSRGNVKPEKLQSKEIGYLGRFPDSRVTLDVRAYQERMKTVINTNSYDLNVSPTVTFTDVTDYINKSGLTLTGVESQLRWKPTQSSEIWWNQSFSQLNWDDPYLQQWGERDPPAHVTTLAWFQELSAQWRFSLIHQRMGSMSWRSDSERMMPSHRTDVRLARAFQLGGNKAEAAITVQSAEGGRPFFLPSENFVMGRKCFLNLRTEF